MSDKTQCRIPRRAGASVAFLGVELSDAMILLVSVFAGLFCGSFLQWGNYGYILMPVGGFFLNRMYIDWQSRTLPGAARKFFYSLGVKGYSPTLDSQKNVYVGDGRIANLGSSQHLNELIEKSKRR